MADNAEFSLLSSESSIDVVFPVLHGPMGEDGTVQGLMELAGVAYVGCGVLASAVGMDKAVMKSVFKAGGLPVLPYVTLLRREWDAAGNERVWAFVDQRELDQAPHAPRFLVGS